MNPAPLPGNIIFAAVHRGPYLSIQPLEQYLGTDRVVYLVEGAAKEERSQCGLPYLDSTSLLAEWGSLENLFKRTRTKAIIRSSSENVQETNIEKLCASAAIEADVPVFVIDDFPGNYWPDLDERLDGLFIEDTSLIELYRERGVTPSKISVSKNPRYEALNDVDTNLRRTEARRSLGLGEEKVLLWVGQPDDDNSYLALEKILAVFQDHQVTLLFRAHPRDSLYRSGKYQTLLHDPVVKIRDVSNQPNVLDLLCASDLVVTQFSSAGVEASQLGIPALFVLFDGLGSKYLQTFKGYDTLPWCYGGCSFTLRRENDITVTMRRALYDISARDQVIRNFANRFGITKHATRNLAGKICAMADIPQRNPVVACIHSGD